MNTASEEREIELLRAEYEHRFSEIMFHSARYHKQADYVQLFATVLLAGATFVIKSEVQSGLARQFGGDEGSSLLFLLLLILALVVELHLVSSLLDSLFMLYLNGSRVVTIEKKLNELVKKDVLIWDSKVIPYFFHPHRTNVGTWVRPDYFVGLWSCSIFGTILILLGFLSEMLIPDWYTYYISALFLLGVVHIHQWIKLATTGVHFIHVHMSMLSGQPDATSSTETKLMGPEARGLRLEHWFSILTFILGCAAFVIANSDVDSSRTYNFLPIFVATGHVILLPLFNFQALRFVRRFAGSIPSARRLWAALFGVFATLIGVSANWMIHNRWRSSGSFNSDMAQWHLALSAVESMIVAVFLATWIGRGHSAPNRKGEALMAWGIFAAFSIVWLADIILRDILLLHTPIWSMIKNHWLTLMMGLGPSLVFVVVYFWRGHSS